MDEQWAYGTLLVDDQLSEIKCQIRSQVSSLPRRTIDLSSLMTLRRVRVEIEAKVIRELGPNAFWV